MTTSILVEGLDTNGNGVFDAEELKALANERDVPYQSLLKVFLAERVARERGRRRGRAPTDA